MTSPATAETSFEVSVSTEEGGVCLAAAASVPSSPIDEKQFDSGDDGSGLPSVYVPDSEECRYERERAALEQHAAPTA